MPSWNEEVYQEQLTVIRQVRALARESRIPYLLDLSNEALPFPFQTQLLRFVKRLWADYTAEFGE
jgi:hypothetical protein